MSDRFMDKTNAVDVLTEYASHIKSLEPTEITWANYQLLTPEQKTAKRYIIIDYPETLENVTNKADKVDGATNGNFAGLDSNGNLTDSGKKASDFLTQHQDISGKADKVSGGISGHIAAIDSSGNLIDGGISRTSVLYTNSNELPIKVLANATQAATIGNAQVRNIYAGTTDMTAGTTALTTGTIYVVYE